MTIFLYALGASILLAAGASMAEHLLRGSRRQARWVWLAAMLLSLLLPALALAGVPLLKFPVVGGGAGGGNEIPADGIPLVGIWASASVLVLSVLVVAGLRTRRRARGWTEARVAGVRVLIAATWGPAVCGVFRSRIVLPRWVLEVTPRERRLIVLHELEHTRSGDLLLLASAAAMLVVWPWHPVLWWQAARLQRAIEMDCDARVARRSSARSYARVLFRAAAQTNRSLILAAGLDAKPLLEQRLRHLLAPRPARRPYLLGAGAAVLVAVACIAPVKGDPPEGQPTIRIIELPPTSVEGRDAGTISPRPDGELTRRPAATPARQLVGTPPD